MRKVILIVAVLFSIGGIAQKVEPTMEKVGNMVKATYYHDNGVVAQTGYLLKGKLQGQWLMYDVKGNKIASGKYENGQKDGKWLFWNDDILREVDYVANQITYVKNWNRSEVVSIE